MLVAEEAAGSELVAGADVVPVVAAEELASGVVLAAGADVSGVAAGALWSGVVVEVVDCELAEALMSVLALGAAAVLSALSVEVAG